MALIRNPIVFPPSGLEDVPQRTYVPLTGPQGGIVPTEFVGGKKRIYSFNTKAVAAGVANNVVLTIPLLNTLLSDQSILINTFVGEISYSAAVGSTFTIQGMTARLVNAAGVPIFTLGQYSTTLLTIVGIGVGSSANIQYQIFPFESQITYEDIENFCQLRAAVPSQLFQFQITVYGLPSAIGSIGVDASIIYRIVSGLKEG